MCVWGVILGLNVLRPGEDWLPDQALELESEFVSGCIQVLCAVHYVEILRFCGLVTD